MLALPVFVGVLGAAWLVWRPAKKPEANDTAHPPTAYSPEVPVRLANARLGEYGVPPIGSDVMYRTTLFGERRYGGTDFNPADENGPVEVVLTDAAGIEQTILLPLQPGVSITLADADG